MLNLDAETKLSGYIHPCRQVDLVRFRGKVPDSSLGSQWPLRSSHLLFVHFVFRSLIPPGTQVYVPAYARHRHSQYYPNPDAFIPERWLHSSPSITYAAFAPFSYGPANCVGKTLARQEMTMIVSALMHKFSFSFAPGFEHEKWLSGIRDYFVSGRAPLLVELVARI